MTQFNKFVYGTLYGLLLLVSNGCSYVQGRDEPVEVAVNPQGDYAAIAYFDCGNLVQVVFISFDGKFEQAKIKGPAMLLDVQLRMAQIAYERVQYVQNERPCGIVIGEEDVL